MLRSQICCIPLSRASLEAKKGLYLADSEKKKNRASNDTYKKKKACTLRGYALFFFRATKVRRAKQGFCAHVTRKV